MKSKRHDLETKLLHEKNAEVQRKFRKLRRLLSDRQRIHVDAAFGDLLKLLTTIEAELHATSRQVGFGAGIKPNH